MALCVSSESPVVCDRDPGLNALKCVLPAASPGEAPSRSMLAGLLSRRELFRDSRVHIWELQSGRIAEPHPLPLPLRPVLAAYPPASRNTTFSLHLNLWHSHISRHSCLAPCHVKVAFDHVAPIISAWPTYLA